MSEVTQKGASLKEASRKIALNTTKEKNEALLEISKALEESTKEIVAANSLDMQEGKKQGISDSLADRLMLDEKRIKGIANAVRQLVDLPDPIGELIESWERPNKMHIEKVRVPMGVIGMIYEARPNVTVDAATIALKTGNAIMLRGSKSALNSNMKIVEVMKNALSKTAVTPDAIALITEPSHDSVNEMLKLNEYLDLIIPRGGESLIKNVVNNATVPVIETGTGNCHIYIDSSADADMAIKIAINQKTQRPGVCNAAETLLIHKDWAKDHLKELVDALREKGVRFAGCEKMLGVYTDMKKADENDWSKEYLDLAIAAKIVDNIDEAIEHINRYGTRHTETIITENEDNAREFQLRVDAAAVNHNVSGRFTDGEMYGFGAEIGISTQKLHARGPMGLKEITSYKYLVSGNGQIRE